MNTKCYAIIGMIYFSMVVIASTNPIINNVINSTTSSLQKTIDQDTIKALAAEFFKELQWEKSQKFTTSVGMVKGSYKDKSSSTHIKGHNQSMYAAFMYQFLPDFSFGITPVKSLSSSKTDAMALRTKSNDKSISMSLDYKIKTWLTLNFGFTRKKGKSTTSIENTSNPDSIGKNSYNIPAIALRFSVPASDNLFFMPDVGFSRTCITNKAFMDNYQENKNKQKLTMDQISFNSKACFLIDTNIIPYISVGYSKITKYTLHVKSRNSFKCGSGLLLFNGLASVDWTVSKANSSVISNNCTANFSMKF